MAQFDSKQPMIQVPRPRCPYCHDEIRAEDSKQGCGDCMAWHHSDCWAEHRRCAACGTSPAVSEEAPPKERAEAQAGARQSEAPAVEDAPLLPYLLIFGIASMAGLRYFEDPKHAVLFAILISVLPYSLHARIRQARQKLGS